MCDASETGRPTKNPPKTRERIGQDPAKSFGKAFVLWADQGTPHTFGVHVSGDGCQGPLSAAVGWSHPAVGAGDNA
jgi:hypothetical protein